jgi:hypothetical protein
MAHPVALPHRACQSGLIGAQHFPTRPVLSLIPGLYIPATS